MKEVEMNISSLTESEITRNDSEPISIDSNSSQIIDSSSSEIENIQMDFSDKRFILKKIGKMLCFLSDKDGNPIFMIGPDWKMYIYFSSFVNILMFVFFFIGWKQYNKVFQIIGYIIYSIFSISYFLSFIINPGYPKNTKGKITGKPEEDYYYCEYCKFFNRQDSNATHCFDCFICIEGYDHHCQWIGKCVGKNNLWLFYLFLFSTVAILCFFGFACFYLIPNKKKTM